MDDVVRAHDGGLVLYRRNGLWQARIHLGRGEYIHRSLKTANTDQAKRLGEELWHDTRYELSKGLPVRKRTLSSVLDEYIRHRERDNEMGKFARSSTSIKYASDDMLRQLKRVQHFWHEYAGNRAIDQIDRKVLGDYLPWRKAYYHSKEEVPANAQLNPADKTLQWEMMVIKMVLRWAKEERKASRQLLHDYLLTLGLSGMRIGEANNLKVRDVQRIRDDRQRENIQFHVGGKTGERIVVPHIDVKEIVDGLLERRGNPGPTTGCLLCQMGRRSIA
jgi:hypothetical protein